MWNPILLLSTLTGLATASKSLTSETFETHLAENEGSFIKMFAPWCGHCKKLAPVWDELAQKHPGVAEVDCTENSELCVSHGVSGYPTLLYFPSTNTDDAIRYSGGRDLDSLEKFLGSSSDDESGVKSLTPSTFGDFVAENDVSFIRFYAPWCQHCQDMEEDWDRVSEEHPGIAQVDCDKYMDLCTSQGVKQIPTMKLYSSRMYEGGRGYDELANILGGQC